MSQTLIDYWTTKADMLNGVRHGLGAGWAVTFTGDSRAAACPWESLGGAPLYESGMPGIAIRDCQTYVPPAVQNLSSRVTVIQVGVNNVYVPLTDPQWGTISGDYSGLLALLAPITPHIVVTTPVPLEKGFGQLDSVIIERCGWLADIAINIKACAAAAAVPCVDLWTTFAQSDNTALAGTTWDSTHFTPATYATIKAMLDPIVAALFAI